MTVVKDEILTKKTELVALLTARANRLTKGLTFCEIHRFNKDRLTSITTMLGTLAATHLQVSASRCWRHLTVDFLSPSLSSDPYLCPLQMAQSAANKWSEIAAQMGVEVGSYAETVSSLVSSAALDEDLAFSSDAA